MIHQPTHIILVLMLTLCLLCIPCFAQATDAMSIAFEEDLATLQTPAQEAIAEGTYTLRTGATAYVPYVAPSITPADETLELFAVTGTFESDNLDVFTVDSYGIMTAVSEGIATLTYTNGSDVQTMTITVADDAMPEEVKQYLYVVEREFVTVQRARLDKANTYTKWYYGDKREIGWCSVFTIYCANASGYDPILKDDIDHDNLLDVYFLQEGQVGNQYQGFFDMDRFVAVPEPGYLVIYGDMDNFYRTTHIGTVTEVVDLGDGQYAITTIEGNMSNTVKSYSYQYDSTLSNHMVGDEANRKLEWNMSELPEDWQTDPTIQYELQTDHWSVFGFCQTWI